MTEEQQSDPSRFIADDEMITFVDDELASPQVVDLDGSSEVEREWVEDPTEEAPNRWTNTETGEYRYQETKPEPTDGEDEGDSPEITEYDVESEFGATVAGIMQESGDPVGEIYAKAWQSFTGRIGDEDLLFDALEQIADHGTQTAENRIRQRLRGMGYDSDEINRTIREAEEAGEPDEPDLVEPEWDDIEVGDTYEFDFGVGSQSARIDEAPEGGRVTVTVEDGTQQEISQDVFEDAVVPEVPDEPDEVDTDDIDVGDTFTFEFAGAEPTEAEVVSINEDGTFTVEYEDGYQQDLTEGDFESATVPESESFDFDEEMDQLNITGTNYNAIDPSDVEDVSRLSENASTEQLEEYVEEAGSYPDDPLVALQEWWEEQGGEAPDRPSVVEIDAAEIVQQLEDGEVSEETAWNEADRVLRDNERRGDELDLKDESGAELARSLLWYRDDTDVDVGVSDLVDFDLPNQGNRATQTRTQTISGISDAMSEMDPAVGAWAISTTKEIQVQELSGNAAGRHRSDGTILMDPTGRKVEMTAAHEFGHQVHTLKGLSAENYPQDFNFGADRDEYGFGTPENVIPADASDFYDDIRKALRKNWDNYQDDEVDEIRAYQKKHGVEYAAVTFAHWARDKAKLQNRDPFAKTMWDVHAGGAEYEEIEDATDMEEGDQVIVEGPFGPKLIEFAEANPDGGEFMAYPMGVEGKKDETALYPFEDTLEDRVVRFND